MLGGSQLQFLKDLTPLASKDTHAHVHIPTFKHTLIKRINPLKIKKNYFLFKQL